MSSRLIQLLATQSEGFDLVQDKCIYELSRFLSTSLTIQIIPSVSNCIENSILIICSKDLLKYKKAIIDLNLSILICDPKINSLIEIDLFDHTIGYIVSSIEQRSCWSWSNKFIAILPMYKDYGDDLAPLLENIPFSLLNTNKKVVLYHGNRIHFENFLARNSRSIKFLTHTHLFVTVYNIKVLGKYDPSKYNLDSSSFVHIQYDHKTLLNLSQYSDLGIVPNLLPGNTSFFDDLFHLRFFRINHMFELFDHTLRFKSSSNAGRCHFFAYSNIPVVAEVTPSICCFVDHSYNGFLFMNDSDLLDCFDQAMNLSDSQRRLFSQRLLLKFDQSSHRAYTQLLNFLLSDIHTVLNLKESLSPRAHNILLKKFNYILGLFYFRANFFKRIKAFLLKLLNIKHYL